MTGFEIKNVTFAYPNQKILSDVSLQCKEGEKIQITGENGAGKTTFLKLLCSLLKPQEGTIRYFDSSFDYEAAMFRKHLGISLDENHLQNHLTVRENLGLYQKLYTGNYSFEKIAPWLSHFGLQTYRETLVRNLSQGQQKKVSLIKALLHEPDVLLLDEPTNSLDEVSKNTLAKILSELAPRQLLLVSTHDNVWAKTWSNREIKIRNRGIE